MHPRTITVVKLLKPKEQQTTYILSIQLMGTLSSISSELLQAYCAHFIKHIVQTLSSILCELYQAYCANFIKHIVRTLSSILCELYQAYCANFIKHIVRYCVVIMLRTNLKTKLSTKSITLAKHFTNSILFTKPIGNYEMKVRPNISYILKHSIIARQPCSTVLFYF